MRSICTTFFNKFSEIFDGLYITFIAKTVSTISSRSTLAVNAGKRSTWGRSRRNQTKRTVKNKGSNN